MQNSTQTTREAVFIFASQIDQQSVRDFVINLVTWSGNNPGRPLRIEMNCQGGNILDGFMLFEEFARLRRTGHHLTIAGYGRLASVASWALQGADVRVIGAHSWILVHEVSSRAEGPVSLLRRELQRCEELQNQTFGILLSRSKLTRGRIDAETAEGRDWWIPAQLAKELGLVDVVEEMVPFAPVTA